VKMSHTLALLIASGALLGIPAAAAAADAGADTGAAMSGQIGQSRTLLDQDGNKMRVTLVGYVASYTRFDATYEAPDAGKRYVGVRFVVKNLSAHKFDECNDSDVQLATRSGATVNTDATLSASGGCYTLLPGRSTSLWTFQMVPRSARLAIVDFIPSSQYSDSVGEWKL
jgi:carbohydrate-selective porin OprB